MATVLLELRGGPLDGRRLSATSSVVVLAAGEFVVMLPAEQRGMVIAHRYGADGRYLGPSRARRRTLWQRTCEWWAGQ